MQNRITSTGKRIIGTLSLASALVVGAAVGFGGNGTWPLNMRGNATEEGGISQRPLDVTFGAIGEQEIIGNGGFTCRMGNAASKRFAATGQLKLGGDTYGIVGVCEHRTSTLVEIVAQSRVGLVTKNLNVTGQSQSTGEFTVISGRAYVTSQNTLIYSVSLEGATPQ